eukprot:gene35730-56414_t
MAHPGKGIVTEDLLSSKDFLEGRQITHTGFTISNVPPKFSEFECCNFSMTPATGPDGSKGWNFICI